ncbi:protein-L-isoaspartate(D-aspartate) O-methyltransferase [Nitrospina watsonii]|uniref:Protein-L-isoaspartate O-methyltransferase n=1 Tax=Nitrospina watsonii TaxID=1323948 RepID=A0ABM9HB01_9BACT|nr:protein-L-isoaspartate(D-aspartate) O-methyltransferase [Nitrospina watsonii]CAI2717303.1 Protein-L-isoaspartate O-methyltransferase [Nitrospina watsonii]
MSLTTRSPHEYSGRRQKMVEEQLIDRGIRDLSVLEAMSRLPRHLFVEPSFQHKAYGDHPLPIGDSQTISQPYIVAAMTEALALKGPERVLEIGTGSGYQTALLAEMAAQVFTVERIKSLGRQAKQILDGLGYTNINYKIFDGTYGWRDQGPYDAILVTAAAPDVPKTLLEQLKDGGRMVLPIGDSEQQELIRVTVHNGVAQKTMLNHCLFVPLVGKYGWPEEE